ncbi:MAG: CDP-glucose 4,6-dehydratase [Ignavibacteriaceae bacterium]|nr:CDP-glucose 4,6-dehydratase [Ignavibacteriaceae bacterium]
MEALEIVNSFFGVYNGKKVLITGDTGFKGSWLAIWLKELGADVYGYSLPPLRLEDNYVVTGLEQHIHHQDGDVRDFNSLLSFLQENQPDIAFHLAAQPLVLDSYYDPKYTFETNLMGTVNFFEAVRRTDSVKAAINVTSDKCYCNNEWVWGYRENDPMGGKDPYSASKGCSELITSSYISSFFSDDESCHVASARAGNVIGGGDWADNRIVPDFFRALQTGEKLLLRYPQATRPWQHVLEPLSGYLLLGAKLLTEGKKYSGGWNFGPNSAANKSVEDIVQKMIELTGEGTYQAENGKKLHEASLLQLDISKARTFLQWSPVLGFNETVDFTVKGYLAEKSLYEARVNQIHWYCELGKNQNISYL